MKIWQKIFLVTLCIITTFLIIIGLLLSDYQLDTELKQEIEKGGNLHKELAILCQSQIEALKNERGKIVLDDSDFKTVVNGVVTSTEYSEYGIEIADENSTSVEGGRYRINRSGDNYILTVNSVANLSGRKLEFVSKQDITAVYDRYESQINQLQTWSVRLSLIAGIILLLLVKLLLHPLKRVEKGMHSIAKGDYEKKLSTKGNSEISILAADVNQMSIEIEKTISEKERLLEKRKIFIGDMAHEMKTPLTAILGLSDILTVRPMLSMEQRMEYSDTIHKEALRLKTMSGKLLELIQLQGGELPMEQLDLKEVMEEVLDVEEPILKEKKITLKATLETCNLIGDKDLLKSLFYNLLDNARKASREGNCIWLKVEPKNETIIITVQDQGMGMPPEEIEKITEPFYMVDKSRSRKNGGAGLGLSLCKEIIALHKGTLQIESKEGEGSIFRIILPIVEEPYENS